MKKIALYIGILNFLMFGSNTLNAQTIQPDQPFASNVDNLVWYPNGTSFCSFNGMTYLFVWNREEPVCSWDYYNWYPYVYEFVNGDFQPFMVKNSQKLEFHYLHEDGAGYATPYRKKVTISGNSLAFTYYGQLWYTCLIERPPYWNYYPGDLYYQLWARYENDVEGWVTWYDSIPEIPKKWKLGACAVDSLLQIVSWDVDTKSLIAEEYMFNGTTKRLDRVRQLPLYLTGDRFGGMIAYKDTLDQQCYIYTSYKSDYSSTYKTFYSPSYQTNTHEYWYTTGTTPGGPPTIYEGSAQGMKTSETLSREMSRRFNYFYIDPDKNSTGSYDLINMEYAIQEDKTKQPVNIRTEKVNLPSTNCLQKVDGELQIGSSCIMVPVDYATEVEGLDGLMQQIQIFYPDKNGRIYGAFFNSDFWRPVPYSSVQSTDLKDDTLYGPQVRDLWTLVGITDGAPPCAIDWPVWENWHFAEDATTFSFKIGTTCSSEITSTYEDSYSLGAKMQTISKVFKFDNSFKYTNTYKSTVKSGTEVHPQLSKNFGLNIASQELGYYIWMIPDITRTSYQVYPWYDKDLVYPVTNSLQYQFRTESVMLKTENIDIAEFPFNINEPNDPQMLDWSEDSRYTLVNSAFYAGVKPMLSLTYTSPSPGDGFDFEAVNTKVESVETSNKYEAGAGITFAIPKAFKLSLAFEGEISYSSEINYETKVGTEVEVSLENLTDAEKFGIYNPSFDVDLYWFKPNVSHWWYIDSLEGQQPWYFAYILSIDKEKIIQQSPAAGSMLRSSDLLFSWTTEIGEISDFVLFISNESMTGPGSTVYQLSCSDRMMASPLDFKPDPGRIYYWSVRGLTPEGKVRWSKSRAFTVGQEENAAQLPLKAEVYPNPARNGQIYVSYDLPEAGRVTISVNDINGNLLQKNDQEYIPAGLTTESLNMKGYAPGIYLIVIQTEKTRLTRKLLIN